MILYVDQRLDPVIAAYLVSSTYLTDRISKRRKQQLILCADNANAICAATLECCLAELGVLRSFSRSCVRNDNSYLIPVLNCEI